MIKTLAALLILSTAALAQDPPREGDKPRPEPRREGDRPRPQEGDQPRPPREGDRPRPPAPREGDQPRPPGPRDGDQPRNPGAPRDGDQPRPPGAPRDNPGRRPVPQFNPEEVRAWLRDNEPETFRRLNQIQGEGRREEVQRILGDASIRMREMNDLKQRDPKAYERMQSMRALEREGMELAEQARRGPPEEKEAATKKLLENLGKQFELREEQRVREISELKRRVEALEKALTQRKTDKEKIVERRKKELLGEKIDEDW